MQLIRRFAAASCLAEQVEARIVSGEAIDLAEHAQLSSTLVRLANRIGLDRVPRDISPLVGEVIEGELAPPQPMSSLGNRMAAAAETVAAAADAIVAEEEPA
jgi:hypothetical protein